jgi:DNA-directed RNA polymerase specialized sigma24 family protein
MVSLDSTLAEYSSAGPLWQFLSLSGPSPASAAARAEQCSLVFTELGRLKPEHREVITYAFFDQLATAEIADRLNISRPAASMLLIRALESLRRRLGVVAGASRETSEGRQHGPPGSG